MKIKGECKRIFFIIFGMVFIITGITFAQQGHGQPPSPPLASDIVSRMEKDLNLTDEQVSEITPVIQNEVDQMQVLMSSKTDREAARDKMEAIHKNTESKLAQYLTPEQLAKWKEKQKKQLSQGQGDKMGPPPEGGERSEAGPQE